MVEKIAKTSRTTMYSVEKDGTVVEHHFPWDKNDKLQREKLLQFERRGFTYERPVAPIPAPMPTPVAVVESPKVETKPYPCKQCSQGFDTPLKLARHTKEHKAR